MKAIAMKMTQEQFESVKDELTGVTRISSFKHDEYLVTNYKGKLGVVSNVPLTVNNNNNRTVYEYFDKDILFDALDIKPKQSDSYLDKKIADVIECAKGLGLNVKVIFE